jgi:hypothetical protein
MGDHGVSGAKAAASYFFQLDHYAQSTGDIDALAMMSFPSCTTCTARVEQAKRIANDGATFTGGETTTRVVETYDQDPATGIWPLDLEITEARTVITRPDGSVEFEADASTITRRVEVAFRDGHWVVLAIAEIPGEN